MFNDLMDRFVVASVRGDMPHRGNPAIHSRLTALLEEVRNNFSPAGAGIEDRMIPSVFPKARRLPFRNRP